MTFVQTWQSKTGYDVLQFTNWLGIGRNKYYSWVNRQGQGNQANGMQPKSHWLTETEKEAINSARRGCLFWGCALGKAVITKLYTRKQGDD